MSNPVDPFEFVKQLWGQMAVPGFGLTGAAGGAAQMPSFDPKELEKRLAELKQVKQWLEMNLNMMGLQINTIEMQLAAMNGLNDASAKAFPGSAPESVGGSGSPAGAPAPWMDPQAWMKFMQQQADVTQKVMQDGAKAMQQAAHTAAPAASRPAPAKSAARKKKS
jgi:hypothetical protein